MKIRFAIALALMLPALGFAADKVQIVEPERLSKYWYLSGTDGAQVPNSGGRGLQAPSCAAVSYVIEKNGTTSHIKLDKIVPEGDLGKVAVSVVKGLTYTAAAANLGKDAVYTYIVMPFNLPDADSKNPAEREQRARALAACKLDDFAARKAP
ncbi:MAG TPA: hypothetical protein VF132_05655 [Rudaea sp.]